MAEWSNAAVLKTVEVKASGGSNPSLSAKQKGSLRESFLFAYVYKLEMDSRAEARAGASGLRGSLNKAK